MPGEDRPGEEQRGLPRTGVDTQAEAIVGGLLVLFGLALRRRSRQLP